MELMKLNVECYSGRKADERPRGFRLEGREYFVEAVLDQWYDPESIFYKVRADDGSLWDVCLFAWREIYCSSWIGKKRMLICNGLETAVAPSGLWAAGLRASKRLPWVGVTSRPRGPGRSFCSISQRRPDAYRHSACVRPS